LIRSKTSKSIPEAKKVTRYQKKKKKTKQKIRKAKKKKERKKGLFRFLSCFFFHVFSSIPSLVLSLSLSLLFPPSSLPVKVQVRLARFLTCSRDKDRGGQRQR